MVERDVVWWRGAWHGSRQGRGMVKWAMSLSTLRLTTRHCVT